MSVAIFYYHTVPPCHGASCPATHPFAYANGDSCCQFAMEAKGSGAAACNAGYIGLSSTCCFHSRGHLDCPQKPCTDATGESGERGYG